MLEAREETRKSKRLEKAGLKTLTARVNNWSLSNQEEGGESGRKRRQEQSHTDSPSKRKRELNKSNQMEGKHASTGDGGRRLMSNQTEGDPEEQVKHEVQKLKVKTVPKRKPTKSTPQVKTRKWVKKKNGLFGWVTSVKKCKPSIDNLSVNIIRAGGMGASNKINENTQTGEDGGVYELLEAAGQRRAGGIVKVKAGPGKELVNNL